MQNISADDSNEQYISNKVRDIQDCSNVKGQTTDRAPALETIVVKIGGSTLGNHDTTLSDVVELHKQGKNVVVVHGGGKIISEWMQRQGVRPKFVNGLRVTDHASLEIVVAVLTGLINKNLVASLISMKGKAIGMSGADNSLLTAKIRSADLGLVGDVIRVEIESLTTLLESGFIPVVAPIGISHHEGQDSRPTLLNINADTAAGEIAAALNSRQLIFLTDVEGVLDTSRRLIPRLTEKQASKLISSKVAAGGMIPKLEACVRSLESGGHAQIIDGRKPMALVDAIAGKAIGTRIG